MLGEQAMKRMAGSKVFLNGLGGVGVEIGNLFFSKDLINRIESLLNKSSLTSFFVDSVI